MDFSARSLTYLKWMVELPARIMGADGSSIDIHRTDNREVLALAATDANGQSTTAFLHMSMVNALAGRLTEWVDETVRGQQDDATEVEILD